MTSTTISASDLDEVAFASIQELVRETTGILLQDNMRFVVARRMLLRCQALGLASFRDYLTLLRYSVTGGRELDELIELLVTNETFFFRETEQLRALPELILPPLFAPAQQTRQPVRIWSAGCSTGEEPFTLAMLLDEHDPAQAGDCDIFASDVSRRVLRHARAGVYREVAMRETNAARRIHFFREENHQFHLKEEIRRRVTFAHINLIDLGALHLVANVDIIICRNVLIYFDRHARAQVLEMFFQKLRPGGYLLLGLAESLVGDQSHFQMQISAFGLLYRKPLAPKGSMHAGVTL